MKTNTLIESLRIDLRTRYRVLLRREQQALAAQEELRAQVEAGPADTKDQAQHREAIDSAATDLATIQRSLRFIEHALARIKHGSYGVCESCGDEIPVMRLRALPEVTRCVACQEQQENRPAVAAVSQESHIGQP